MTARRRVFEWISASRVVVALVVAIIAGGSARAQTIQAFEEYGVSPRDAAMGNSGTAVAEDFAAAFYNPAGLTQPEGFHLQMGYKFLNPDVYAKIDGYDKGRFTNYPSTQWFLIGMTSDLEMPEIVNPKYTGPFSFGFAFALSRFVHSYTNYYDPYTPYFFRYNDRPVALLSMYFAMGAKITEWLSIGAGMVVAPSITYTDARTRTDIYLPEGRDVSLQGITNRAYSVLKPHAGLMFRVPIGDVPDRLRFGFDWRDEVEVIDGKGDAVNRIIVHAPGVEQPIEPVPPQAVKIDNLSGYTPMQASLGVSAKTWRGGLVTTETIWKKWSEFRNYFLWDPEPAFRDTWQQRSGLEQTIGTPNWGWLESFSLRSGYYFEPSPVPDQNGLWNLLDNDKHVVTGGLGLRIDRVLGIIKAPVNVDASGQAHFLDPMKINNDGDPSYPAIETGGMVYSGTFTFELAW